MSKTTKPARGTSAPSPRRYRLAVGVSFPDGAGGETRLEPGDVTDLDMPESVATHLQHIGVLTALAAEPDA